MTGFLIGVGVCSAIGLGLFAWFFVNWSNNIRG
jgi:hypothetical protein